MERSTDRMLTTHTGSLPRPEDLLRLLRAKDDGEPFDEADFELKLDAATREVLRRQIDCGLDVVNDGEMSKISYATYVADRLAGFGGTGSFPPMADVADFPEYGRRMAAEAGLRSLKTPACLGPVSWKDRAALDADLRRLREGLNGVQPRDVFMTAASPGVIAVFIENRFYPTYESYLEALADVMKEEYQAICAAGFVLQLDCPDLAVGRHTRFAHASLAQFLEFLELHVAAINRALADIPPDRVRLHLCWGNYEGPHHHDVPLSEIIGPVLQARADAFSFEASNPRHEHEWSVFKKVKLPDGKILIPGVIDSSTNYIEHPDLVAERIVRFAEVVGRENVIAGTDCGFGTFAAYSPVDPAIAWAKLQALSEGARAASRHLWGR